MHLAVWVRALLALQAAKKGEDGEGSNGQWTRFVFNKVRAGGRCLTHASRCSAATGHFVSANMCVSFKSGYTWVPSPGLTQMVVCLTAIPCLVGFA